VVAAPGPTILCVRPALLTPTAGCCVAPKFPYAPRMRRPSKADPWPHARCSR
jgi:hypothetical protein